MISKNLFSPMPVFDIIEHTSKPTWWDKAIDTHCGFFCSTSHWADFYASLGIGRGIYLEIQKDQKRYAAVLIYEHIIGGEYLLGLPLWILRIISRIPQINTYSLHLQPTLLVKMTSESERGQMLTELISFLLSKSAKTNRNIMPADILLCDDVKTIQAIHATFPKNTELSGTGRLMLPSSVEMWESSLPESVKSALRKAAKMGITVERVQPHDYKVFYDNLSQSWKDMNLAVNHEKYYSSLISKNPDSVHYYIAKCEEKVISGLGIMRTAKTIFEFSMFTTTYGRSHKIPGGDVIKYQTISDAISNGYAIYDMNMIGIPEDINITQKIQQINFFKLKWGGTIIYGLKVHHINSLVSIIKRLKHRFLGI